VRALLLAAFLAAPASAQVTIAASVSKIDVTLDEQFVLSVTVSGPDASLPEPRLPAVTNLSLYDSGRNQSLSIVNGQVSSTIVYTYVVVPRAVGKALIPPITAAHKGQSVATEPIEINVRKPGSGMPGAPSMPRSPPARATPQPGQRAAPDLFITADVDLKSPYVNQQVTLTVRFHTAVSLIERPQYDAPALSGFLAEDLPPERHGQTQAHGRTYYYSEIKTALFPAQPGRVTIGPAVVRTVLPGAMTDPFAADFFDRFFQPGHGAREARLASDPIALAAQPLPEEGKPQGFSGGVGRFSVSAAVDRTKAKVGDALNLTVTVAGEGNLKTIGAPVLPDAPQLRFFDTVTSLSLDKKGDVVRGSKVYKTVVVPRASGAVTIPPIVFHYFDPKARAYRAAETAPIRLEVAPGEAGAAAGPGAAAPRGLTEVSQDLRYLLATPRRGAATRALEALAFAGPLHAVPFLVFGAALGWTRWRDAELSDPAAARARGALRAAQARLRKARAAPGPEAAALLSEALAGYLADKLGQPASGLTARRALELARARRPGAAADLLDGVRAMWEELDMLRFAPAGAGGGGGDEAARLASLLERLEREVFS
jgi:hypothetical protein